ncbi:Sacs, partial [Symbiodinium sp. CCMP2456]
FVFEALQNAEDSGRADRFASILDLRSHAADRVRPQGQKWRQRLNGPAFIFWDNGGFQEDDWKSLQNMYDSEKKHRPSKVGKYGMGSRSFFHMGDMIQIVSGTKYAILDPDNRLRGGHGERTDFLRKDFDHKSLLDAFPDECSPFVGLFGCTMDVPFKGTLIRVPFRLEEFAHFSSFMPKVFSVSRARSVFSDFKNELSNGDLMLFLSNIRTIEIFEWEDGQSSYEKIVSVTLSPISTQDPPNDMQNLRCFLEDFEAVADLHAGLAEALPASSAESQVPHVHDLVHVEVNEAGEVVKNKWMRYGAFFDPSKPFGGELREECSEVPFVCLALPLLGDRLRGRAWTYLPLPVETGLPVHMHAGFCLTNNRRDFWRNSPGLDAEHESWARWNDYILQSVMPELYAKSIEWLMSGPPEDFDHSHNMLPADVFQLWPDLGSTKDVVKQSVEHFAQSCSKRPVLLDAADEPVSPSEASLMDLPTEPLQRQKHELQKWCRKLEYQVVDPPSHIRGLLEHHSIISAHGCRWLLDLVVQTLREPSIETPELPRFLLALLHWARSSMSQMELNDLKSQLVSISWIPVGFSEQEISNLLPLGEAFDPKAQLSHFRTVASKQAQLNETLSTFTAQEVEDIFHMLRRCGLKSQLTWEDVVLEAKDVASRKCLETSRALYKYLSENSANISGDKGAALKQLPHIKWVEAAIREDPGRGDKAASMSLEVSAHRTVEEEPEVWIEQLIKLTGSAPFSRHTLSQSDQSCKPQPIPLSRSSAGVVSTEAPTRLRVQFPRVASEMLAKHMDTVFRALQHMDGSVLRGLGERLRAWDVLWPCESTGDGECYLFPWMHTALDPKQNSSLLCPVAGKIRGRAAREVARILGAPKVPNPNVLLKFLPDVDMAKACSLCEELAQQASAGEEWLCRALVPTKSGKVIPSRDVSIDDASGSSGGTGDTIKDGAAFSSDFRCWSQSGVRVIAGEVGAVPWKLRELVIMQKCRNSDDFGAKELHFFFDTTEYGHAQIVDSRCSGLQGPALYICSDKPLAPEDIRRMQQVGKSQKRHDFLSSGRFGVGMNVMYRYSDCPTLLADGQLHFFDLMRSFVARDGQKRGKVFGVQDVKEHFPDTWAPFDHHGRCFPVVFRLALRKNCSELAGAVGDDDVRDEMMRVMRSHGAGMLLFCKSLEVLTFQDLQSGQSFRHHVEFPEPNHKEAQISFFRSLGPVVLQTNSLDEDLQLAMRKHIVSSSGAGRSVQDWAIVHRVAGSDNELRLLAQEFYSQSQGFAVLPYAAAAVRMDGSTQRHENGYICCGLPTPEQTGSPAWINGSFIFTSSRKHFPLPSGGERGPEQRWNLKLLQGPAAWCLKELLLIRKELVRTEADLEATYFKFFPAPDTSTSKTHVPSVLAESALRYGWREEIFPVVFFSEMSQTAVRWVRGPNMVLTSEQLRPELQACLASDGLPIVHLPSNVRKLVNGHSQSLSTAHLCRFLSDLWHEKGHQSRTSLNATNTWSLQDKAQILELLAFVHRGDWHERVARGQIPSVHTCDHLQNVPLLLHADESLCMFGTPAFTTGSALLRRCKHLFVHRDIWRVLQDIPLHAPDVDTRVKIAPWGLRDLKISDLQEYRAELEADVATQPEWSQNQLLKELWKQVCTEAKTACHQAALQAVWDWKILPITGHGGPQITSLGSSAEVTLWPSPDFQMVVGACMCCRLGFLQVEFAKAGDMGSLVQRHIVSKPIELLQLLVRLQENAELEDLTGSQRHELLTFLAVLCITTPVRELARKLPLFKLALAGRPSFTALFDDATHYCCIQPCSPGIGSAEDVAGQMTCTTLLAWPTEQVEPIYKKCGVSLYTAECYVLERVLPSLGHLVSGPCSEQAWDVLNTFIVQESSTNITEKCKSCAFVRNRSGHIMRPKDVLDWEQLPIARCFEAVLHDHMAASDIQEDIRKAEVIKTLGLKLSPGARVLRVCARHLQELAEGQINDRVQEMSCHLVEALCQAMSAELRNPTDQQSDLAELVEIARMKILVVRTLRAEGQIQQQRQLLLEQDRMSWTEGTCIELQSFADTSFLDTQAQLWSVRPAACHSGRQLDHLMTYHADWMFEHLRAFVKEHHLPASLVVQHMRNLCPLGSADDEYIVSGCSAMWSQLRTCRALVSRKLQEAGEMDLEPLKEVHCVTVEFQDAANLPDKQTFYLARPRSTFFFSSGDFKHWQFDRFFHKAVQDFKDLYTALGVREDPDWQDFVLVTKKVAEQQRTLSLWFHDRLMAACLRGWYKRLPAHVNTAVMHELHVPSRDHRDKVRLLPAAVLCWADLSEWLPRCAHADFDFCCTKLLEECAWPRRHADKIAEMSTCAHREILEALTKHAGLKRLSDLVVEVLSPDEYSAGDSPDTKAHFEQFLRSEPFLAALKAIWRHHKDEPPAECDNFLAKVTDSLSRLQVLAVTPLIVTELAHAHSEGPQVIPGSRQELVAFFDTRQHSLTISEEAYRTAHDARTRKCLMRAIERAIGLAELTTMMWGDVALKNVTTCSIDGGVAKLPSALYNAGILADLPSDDSSLRPGSELPDEVHDELVQSMSRGFENHAHVAVLIDGKYYLGVVQEWHDSGNSQAESLSRLYKVMLRETDVRTVRYMDMFNLKGRGVPQATVRLAAEQAAAGSAQDTSAPEAVHTQARQLEEVKHQLREMKRLSRADYRNVMRRLYLTWHPDRAGNTHFASMMFRMIRRHSDWFQDGQPGDDEWLDEYTVGHEELREPAPAREDHRSGSENGRHASRRGSSQASWFDEFEDERARRRERPLSALLSLPFVSVPSLNPRLWTLIPTSQQPLIPNCRGLLEHLRNASLGRRPGKAPLRVHPSGFVVA